MSKAGEIRRAGAAQGWLVVIAIFLPILAITSMLPGVPAMIHHFADDPNAGIKASARVTAPELGIARVAMFVGFAVDRFGRRLLSLPATLLYGLIGTTPFFLSSLDAAYVSRFALAMCEAVIITTLSTLVAELLGRARAPHLADDTESRGSGVVVPGSVVRRQR